MLNTSYRLLFAVLMIMLCPEFHSQGIDKGVLTIFLAGNSTVADKPYKDGNPEKGWGQLIPLYFKEGVRFENHAVNGRSTKSFTDEGKWDSLANRVNTGDYVFIEFGHNDAKKEDPKRFADANTDYRYNLERFITDVKKHGGVPVLVTPIVRRRFDETGKFYDVHGDYPKVVRETAAKFNVILIDLHKLTEEYIIKLGPERSKEFYLHIDADEYNSLPKGLEDNTHLSPKGAFRVCDFVIAEIKEKIPQLKVFIKD